MIIRIIEGLTGSRSAPPKPTKPQKRCRCGSLATRPGGYCRPCRKSRNRISAARAAGAEEHATELRAAYKRRIREGQRNSRQPD